MKHRTILNRHKAWIHYAGLALISLALLTTHIWTADRQQYSAEFRSDFGEDFLGIVTLGRQMLECRDLPIFMFPGKIYDGPVKPFALYFPCFLFGYHALIPVIMTGLLRSLIAFCCYLLGRKMVSPLAGLIALVLCGAMDQWLVIIAFQYSFFYDVWILQSLIIALMAICWSEKYRTSDAQPGAFYCLSMGLVAGCLWYTHPLGAATIISAAIYLLLSHGKQIFTWRVPTVASTFFAGSLPFWIYWIRHPGIIESARKFTTSSGQPMSLFTFFFSGDGYLWLLLSPSGSMFIRVFVGTALAATVTLFTLMLVRGCRGLRGMKFSGIWNKGLPISSVSYAAIFSAILSAMVWATLGIAQFVGVNFIYGVELWFWLMISASWAIHAVIKRSKTLICVAAVLAPFYIWTVAIRDFPAPHPVAVKRYNNISEDARQLLQDGHTNILASEYDDYMYMVTGPGGLNVAERFMPWSMPMADTVEQAEMPVILGSLHKPTLGHSAWVTEDMSEEHVHHSFVMPQPGRMIPDNAWTIDVSNDSSAFLPNLKDRDAWTSWSSAVDTNDIALTITFDKPRAICRIMLWSHRRDLDWDRSSYFNLSSRGLKEDQDTSTHTMPLDMEIQGRQPNGDWVTLADEVSERGYFWDGGRIFYDKFERHRTDIRLAEITTKGIRIIDRGRKWRPRLITELYLFETAEQNDKPSSPAQDIPKILDVLKSANVKRVYADRFVSAQIAKSSNSIEVWQPSFLRPPSYKLTHAMPWPWYTAFEILESEGTAIIADSAFAPEIAATLQEADVPAVMQEHGYWVIFLLNDAPIDLNVSGLVWCGWSLLHYPDKARQKDADSICTTLPSKIDIAFDTPPRFENGAELLGIDFGPSGTNRGDYIPITYYWRVPDKWEHYAIRPVVFIHYMNGGTAITDDHLLLDSITNNQFRDVLPGEILRETRHLRIPLDAPRGVFELEIGLHNSGDRVKVKAKDKLITKVRRSAIHMKAFTLE